MGASQEIAINSISQASLFTVDEVSRVRKVVRCQDCDLNQFLNLEKPTCKRCGKLLITPVVSEAVQPQRTEAEESKPIKRTPAIGTRLQQIRSFKGISQRQLAQVVGCPRSYLSKIETNKVMPHIVQLERVCAGVGITVADLWNFDLPARHIALATLGSGGPAEDLIAALVEALPKLSQEKRKVLLFCTEQIMRGQMPFPEWCQV